jgi:hypothetical protein
MGLPLCGVSGDFGCARAREEDSAYVPDVRTIIDKYENSMAQMVRNNESLTKGGIIIVVASDTAFIL